MVKLRFSVVFTMMCFAFSILLLFEFRHILKTRQQHGQLRPNESKKLYKGRVFTKMECLDFCLRNPPCNGFQMEPKVSGGNEKYWICQGQHATLPRRTGCKRWIFNVSSNELQEILSKAAEAC
ncbi:uncharacterized protein LOC144663998 [Oculina patagonica]